MFDLEASLAKWREELAKGGTLDRDSLAELEDHLRDAIERRVAAGDEASQAFEAACASIGDAQALHLEYAKVHPKVPWRRRLLNALVGYVLVSTLIGLVFQVSALLEVILLALGLGAIMIETPWSIPVDPNSSFFAGLASAMHEWHQLSLATLFTMGAQAVLFALLVWTVTRGMRGSLIWVTKAVDWCQTSLPTQLAASVGLGVAFWLVNYGMLVPYVLNFLRYTSGDPDPVAPYLEYQLIYPLIAWIVPLALTWIGWSAFRIFQSDQRNGLYHTHAIAVCGFIFGAMALQAINMINGIGYFALEAFWNIESILSPPAVLMAQVTPFLFALVFIITLSGVGFPTLRRFLSGAIKRPWLIPACWLFMQWASVPFTLAFYPNGLYLNDWEWVNRCFLAPLLHSRWAPLFLTLKGSAAFAIVLTSLLIALNLSARRPASRPRSVA